MLQRSAQAGTLESSDCMVSVAPDIAFSLDYRSANRRLFEERTERIAQEIATRYAPEGVRVQIADQGALEATLRARIETAFERASREE